MNMSIESLAQTASWLKEASERCKRNYDGLLIRYQLSGDGVVIQARSTLLDNRVAEVSKAIAWSTLEQSLDDPLIFMERKLLEDLRTHLLNLEKSDGS